MSTNPYQTPQASVITQDAIPDSFLQGKVSAKLLGFAGWLAIIYILVSLPVLALSLYAEYVQEDALKSLSDVFSIATFVISSYLFLVLKAFLEARIPNLKITLLTYLLVTISLLVLVIPKVINEPEPTDYVSLIIYYAALFIPAGIILLLYGIKLVRVKVSYPNLKVYGWLSIASAICFISVVLFMLAIPLGFINDIFMALLFFQGRRELLSHLA